jgi:NAD(P)H-dependent flavin oxidoreductase YrpB (nitropropane dioxygenase family)
MKGGERFVDGDKERLDGFPEYCGLCGWALALAHAKSGDAAMIAGYCGKSDKLDDAIAKFALAYLKQTKADHAALVDAVCVGRIEVS